MISTNITWEYLNIHPFTQNSICVTIKGTEWLVINSQSQIPFKYSSDISGNKNTQNTKVIKMFVGSIISKSTHVNRQKYLSPLNHVELCSMIEETKTSTIERQLRCTPQVVRKTYALAPALPTPTINSKIQAPSISNEQQNLMRIRKRTSNLELLIL